MKRYALIRLSGFTRAEFARAKGKGLATTNFDSMSKSKDGRFGIVSWNVKRSPQIPPGLVVQEFDRLEARAFIRADKASWWYAKDGSTPVVSQTARELPTGVKLPSDEASLWEAVRIIAIGVGLIALIAWVFYLLLGVKT